MNFGVGQKVTPVAKNPFWVLLGKAQETTGPKHGDICTVTQTGGAMGYSIIWLAEFPGPRSFVSSAFRPVVERKTDISIFVRMLQPSKVRERA